MWYLFLVVIIIFILIVLINLKLYRGTGHDEERKLNPMRIDDNTYLSNRFMKIFTNAQTNFTGYILNNADIEKNIKNFIDMYYNHYKDIQAVELADIANVNNIEAGYNQAWKDRIEISRNRLDNDFLNFERGYNDYAVDLNLFVCASSSQLNYKTINKITIKHIRELQNFITQAKIDEVRVRYTALKDYYMANKLADIAELDTFDPTAINYTNFDSIIINTKFTEFKQNIIDQLNIVKNNDIAFIESLVVPPARSFIDIFNMTHDNFPTYIIPPNLAADIRIVINTFYDNLTNDINDNDKLHNASDIVKFYRDNPANGVNNSRTALLDNFTTFDLTQANYRLLYSAAAKKAIFAPIDVIIKDKLQELKDVVDNKKIHYTAVKLYYTTNKNSIRNNLDAFNPNTDYNIVTPKFINADRDLATFKRAIKTKIERTKRNYEIDKLNLAGYVAMPNALEVLDIADANLYDLDKDYTNIFAVNATLPALKLEKTRDCDEIKMFLTTYKEFIKRNYDLARYELNTPTTKAELEADLETIQEEIIYNLRRLIKQNDKIIYDNNLDKPNANKVERQANIEALFALFHGLEYPVDTYQKKQIIDDKYTNIDEGPTYTIWPKIDENNKKMCIYFTNDENFNDIPDINGLVISSKGEKYSMIRKVLIDLKMPISRALDSKPVILTQKYYLRKAVDGQIKSYF